MSRTEHYIDGKWIAGGGEALQRENPSTGQLDWSGRSAASGEIEQAVAAARDALDRWASTSLAERETKIQALAEGYKHHQPDLVDAICRQTGKPRWEAAAEVQAMIGKAAISISAQRQRRGDESRAIGDLTAGLRFRPVGALAVLGPFNMPGHLANGHLMPAVLAGNTVVFKPSELAPAVGAVLAQVWHEAAIPPGVFNLLQGGAAVGAALTTHPQIDGVLFTGSFAAGSAIHRSLAGQPQKLLALEMGGNNPLIVWDCTDVHAAALCIIQSAFITSGQRCSCARRLIVRENDPVLSHLAGLIPRIGVGLYSDMPEPFMGTVISAAAAGRVMDAQADLLRRGARAIVPMRVQPQSSALLSPGLMDVSTIERRDEEIFGPLLQVISVADFDAALREANATRYGLSAGLLTDSAECRGQFKRRIRAGVIAINRPMTGARSDLPFGGIGASGNHRPSALMAAEYCADAVATVEADRVSLPPADLAGMPLNERL